MTRLTTSDVTRILHAARRRWPIIVAAGLVGAVLGLLWSTSGKPVGYQVVLNTVPLQSQDAISATTTVTVQPSLEEIISTVASAETRARLGTAAADSSVSGTVAVDRGSLTFLVSAPTASKARQAAQAYAAEASRVYVERSNALLSRAITSIDAGIESITVTRNSSTDAAHVDAGATKLAELQVQKQMLASLTQRPAPGTSVTALPSSSSRLTAIATLALLFGGLAAALVGLLGLYDRTLRYRDDVEGVVGPDALLGHVRNAHDLLAVRASLDRLGKDGRPVSLVPVGDYAIAPELTSGSHAFAGGRHVLVTLLGTDTSEQVDLAYRMARATGDPLLGVLAVEPQAGVTIPR